MAVCYQPQKQQSMMTAIRMIIQRLSSNALPKQPAMDTPPCSLISSDFLSLPVVLYAKAAKVLQCCHV